MPPDLEVSAQADRTQPVKKPDKIPVPSVRICASMQNKISINQDVDIQAMTRKPDKEPDKSAVKKPSKRKLPATAEGVRPMTVERASPAWSR